MLGLCGNSGNSSEPHLHYHLQNTPAIQSATGIKCYFTPVAVTKVFGCSIKWKEKSDWISKARVTWANEPVSLQSVGVDSIHALVRNNSSKLRLTDGWEITFWRSLFMTVFVLGLLAVQYRGAIDNFQFAGNPEYEEYLEPAISEFLAGRPVSQPETASFGCAIQSVYYQLPKIL